ncbi:MAG: hypothetical protein DWQ05_18490 [Calditrichaeota bacterium]|nr:MAG: hypothetical protein DWQ05_18490 [Calditrichota bacterium]
MQDFITSAPMLFSLILILATLFVLQIWAIIRVKMMLKRVSEIHEWVQAGKLGVSAQFTRYKRPVKTCKNCLFRSTFLAQEKDIQFVYYCKKNDIETSLDNSCLYFQVDPEIINS